MKPKHIYLLGRRWSYLLASYARARVCFLFCTWALREPWLVHKVIATQPYMGLRLFFNCIRFLEIRGVETHPLIAQTPSLLRLALRQISVLGWQFKKTGPPAPFAIKKYFYDPDILFWLTTLNGPSFEENGKRPTGNDPGAACFRENFDFVCYSPDETKVPYRVESRPCFVTRIEQLYWTNKGYFSQRQWKDRAAKNQAVHSVNCAIVFSTLAYRNYFHWIVEALPSLYLLEGASQFDGMPLVIDSNMPLQNIEALHALNHGSGRAIISGDLQRSAVQIGQAHLLSPPVWMPEHFEADGHNYFLLSRNHLLWMRQRLYEFYDIGRPSQRRRIMILRKYRDVCNGQVIQALLRRYGFEFVRPEKLTFEDQVRLFSEAEIVIGAGGAAIANTVFCQPGTQVIVLNSAYGRNNSVFSTIAGCLDLKYAMLLGEPKYGKDSFRAFWHGKIGWLFTPFHVDPEELEHLLKRKASQERPNSERAA